jgi:hypothetical protein
LARSQPAIFLAGAMAAGFALSRFLKSSAPENTQGPHGGPSAAGEQSAHRAHRTASASFGR